MQNSIITDKEVALKLYLTIKIRTLGLFMQQYFGSIPNSDVISCYIWQWKKQNKTQFPFSVHIFYSKFFSGLKENACI